MSRFLVGFVSSLVCALPMQAQDALALKAKAILEKHCYECHGKSGANEGGFNYALDRDRLLERGKVKPGDLKASKLYKRLTSEDDPMPPDYVKARPTPEEIATIKEWIAKGATPFVAALAERKFISNEDVLASIAADLASQRASDRLNYRYFTLTHLYNAGLSDDELQSYRNGLSKLINSLSWNRNITIPKPIDDAKTILRIDLTDFDWTEKTWDRIVAFNPYSVTYKTAAALKSYEQTRTQLPMVRADWFVFAASRPPLYHDILELPKTDLELERRLELRVTERIEKEKVIRAAFNNSGVSQNNRLIERHVSTYGSYWKSYDFAKNEGKKNLFETPLGPELGSGGVKFYEGGFQHDGGEIIFSLPNKLQAYFLIDGKGNRIDKGPTEVVTDKEAVKKGLKPDVVNGIGCMRCHTQGMREKFDEIRPHVVKNKNSFSDKEVETLLGLYKEKETFAEAMKEDVERFRRAMNKALNKPEDAKLPETEPIDALAVQFEQTMNLKLVAAELGVTPETFEKVLKASPRLSRTFGPVRVEGGTVQRGVFIDSFGDAISALSIGTFIPHDDNAVIGGGLPQEITLDLGGGVKMKMVLIDPKAQKDKGKFKMGSPEEEKERSDDEDQVDVELTKPYYLARV